MSKTDREGDTGEAGIVDNDPGSGSTRSRRGPWILAGALLCLGLVVAGIAVLREFPNAADEEVVQIADVSSERLLAFGSVVGHAADYETHAWLGLPYARPPLAELRWRAPQSPEAWADTFDALRFGPPCVQLTSRLGGVRSEDPDGFAGSEDCLYLNVWAPRAEPDRVATGDDRLPVMVWIHGGGNRVGHSGSAMSDGARLAGTENVVVVSFNYRLGPLGWFSHPAFRAMSTSPEEASGNFGTLDQVRALEWVAENIEEFGGDPHNITIFGESAGGRNVLALLLVEKARNLFHRAIVQSGSTDSVSRAEAENEIAAKVPGHRHSSAEIVVSLLQEAGVVPDRDAAGRYAEALPETDLAEFLRGRSAREILDAYRDPDRRERLDLPQLIRDGSLLPTGDWITEYREGRFNAVPIMLGTNRDEMKLFLFSDEDHVRERFGMFFSVRDLDDYERRSRYHSDLWTVRGVTRPASAISDSGMQGVFAYRFDWDELPRFLGGDLAVLLGAAHGFEIPFVFGTFDLGSPMLNGLIFNDENAEMREALSATMMSYWAEFARHGRPGRGSSGDQPAWEAWTHLQSDDTEIASMLILDAKNDGGIRLSQSQLSRDHVIAAVDADPGLDQDEKCQLFHDLFAKRRDWNSESLRGIGRRGCADFIGK